MTRFPAPGGPYDVDEADYHANRTTLSSSGARTLTSSCPARYLYERDHGRPDTPAFEFGRAYHSMVLGSGAPVVEITAKTRGTKAEDLARAVGQIPLITKDYQRAQAMAEQLRAHPIAGPLFARPGHAEQTFVAPDPDTGVMCRVRVDWMPDVPAGARVLAVDLKGLALDTPIPTVAGWSTMVQLAVGDRIFDGDGRPCTVTAKSEVHWRTCYRMRFDDGSSVICDDEHLWATRVTTGHNTIAQTAEARTTEEIRRTLRRFGGRQHRVPIAGALQLPDAELPIDPYVLGAWLGDGTAAEGRISGVDDELFEHIAARGYAVSAPPPSTVARGCPTRSVHGLQRQLRGAEILGHKHIPAVYLRASVGQRTDLLRGLMDTDGTWNVCRGQAVFTSTDKALAEQVCELVVSLGQRALVRSHAAQGYGHTVTAYTVPFRPTGGLNPFLLSRKACQVKRLSDARSMQRIVTDVEPVPVVPTQCITVDSPDSTYLCTASMVPTHNTTASAEPAAFAKSMANYGYHQQGAFYADVLELALGLGVPPRFVLVAQEKDPPYLITIAEPDDEALAWGRELNRHALRTYARCSAASEWPGYETQLRPEDGGIARLSLPGWQVAAYENTLNGALA